MKDDNWTICNSCRSEYKVVSSISIDITESYCPFCGIDIEDESPEDYDEFFEQD